MNNIKTEIRSIASANKIDEIRFIDCGELEPISAFSGRQPLDIMPEGKSIIVSSIYIGNFQIPNFDPTKHLRTSRLTLSGFYFNIVNPLESIRDHLISKGFKAHICDGLSDNNSFPLKAAAIKAGLGWNGKNTLLVNDRYGTFQALGGIITDADLSEIHTEMENKCGTCTKCIDACPTNALETPRVLSRDKCISNFLEEEILPDLEGLNTDYYFFECDTCQEACPWNKTHLTSPLVTEMGKTFDSRSELSELLTYQRLSTMEEQEYMEKIYPLLTGFDLSFDMFRRNIALAHSSSQMGK